KLDVIGILVSLGMLRLRAGTNRCDPGWSCKKTSRQYPGNEQRYREYTSPHILAHNSSTPTGNVPLREVLKCSDRRVALTNGKNHRLSMSEADIGARPSDVRFTPKSGHWNSISKCPLCAKSRHSEERTSLFDHLVGAGKQRLRHGEPECLRGF